MRRLKRHRKPHTVIARCALLAVCALVVCMSATAQRRATPRPSPTPAADNAQRTADVDNADLSITANVTARELRFEVVPNATVEFPGQPKRETVWDAQRQNLPRPVQPFKTYRDIGIRLVITSVFADIDRIVAEALGETPPTDDSTPTDSAAPPANNAPAPTTVNNTPPTVNNAPLIVNNENAAARAHASSRRTPTPAAKTDAPPPRPRRARRPR